MIACPRAPVQIFAAAVITLTVVTCLVGSASGQSAPSPDVAGLAPRVGSLQPRSVGLRPRVVGLQPRVVDLQPRVASVAPKQTAPHSFTVNADVLFAFDSSDLSPVAQDVLAGVVGQLHSSPAGTVAIVGYTDSIGTAAYNIGLSQRRAAAVQTFLGAQVANPALTFTSQGLGEADPVAPNTLPNGQDNPAGRQQNRRVTITYTPG